jgi:hypothetical protein
MVMRTSFFGSRGAERTVCPKARREIARHFAVDPWPGQIRGWRGPEERRRMVQRGGTVQDVARALKPATTRRYAVAAGNQLVNAMIPALDHAKLSRLARQCGGHRPSHDLECPHTGVERRNVYAKRSFRGSPGTSRARRPVERRGTRSERDLLSRPVIPP